MYVFMYENGKMSPIETFPEKGGEENGGELL
jgi:hypothetical protein